MLMDNHDNLRRLSLKLYPKETPMRFIPILLWLLAFAAHPAAAASTPELQSIEQQLGMIVSTKQGDHGIAALDLGTGEVVGVSTDRAFPMASTVKIAIAANYLAEVEQRRRSMDDVIGGRRAGDLMDAMIVRSDNHATDLLLMNLGGPRAVQNWLQQRNVRGLRIDRTIAQLLAAKRDLYDVRDSSTPRAMVELLARLDKGELLDPWGRHHLLSLMGRCITGKNRIRGMLPAGTHVQNKTGTLNGLATDVGIITMPDGRRVAVAFFSRHGVNGPRTIAETARAVYDGFSGWLRKPFQPAAQTVVPHYTY
jgi:beta-lactamase class A